MMTNAHEATLKTAVERELRLDPRVNETEIGVALVNGVVTLGGCVDTEAEKKAAGEAAHRVLGILDVANDVMVRVPIALARTDADVAEGIRDALERRVRGHGSTVHTTVRNGVVSLTGEVETLRDAEDAVDAAEGVAGGRRVDDHLVVRTPVLNLIALHHAIEKALGRRAEREADRIDISAHDGVVTLAGKVNSRSDKTAIVELVCHAPGVRRVDDRLCVIR